MLAPGAVGPRPWPVRGRSSSSSQLAASLRHQLQEYFDHSSLHGVSYVREQGRPFREKFLWFCFTTVGAVATLIIISSLWEKFQTNPTITGLDTDFHNWDVPFPAVSLCPVNPLNDTLVDAYVQEHHQGEPFYRDFIAAMGRLSLENLEHLQGFFRPGSQEVPEELSLAKVLSEFAIPCQDKLQRCEFKGPAIACCDNFFLHATELGFCYTFNSKFAWPDEKGKFQAQEILETDETLGLKYHVSDFQPDSSPGAMARKADKFIKVYLYSHDQLLSADTQLQATMDYDIEQMYFSEKRTYTTEATRQLSIRQRRCVFPEEVRLDVSGAYSYSFCMVQCRMRRARRLCGCVAPFYPPTDGYRHCGVRELQCLAENAAKLREPAGCRCYLGCENTVYEVERLLFNHKFSPGLDMVFVSWPLIRYKREVLFGWVDLLVSFGGIAGLFLGFSLLSGVEIVYYFTMRACCMLVRNKDELRRLQHEFATAPRPPLDLSLTPYCLKAAQADQRPLIRAPAVFCTYLP